MNKKGKVFTYLITVFTFILLLTAYTLFTNKYELEGIDGKIRNIGENQYSILRSTQEAENAMLYVDQSAKMALQQSIYDLGKKQIGCSVYGGYALWNTQEQDCFPDQEKEFKRIFSKKMDAFLVNYPNTQIPLSNYYLSVISQSPLDVAGIALRGFKVNIGGEREEGTAELPEKGFESSVSVEEYTGDSVLAYKIAQNSRSRGSNKVEYIILHHTAGATAKDALNSFVSEGTSAHYVVARDGTIIYAVDESRSAQHAGCKNRMDLCYLPNMNVKSIGIEIVNCGVGKPGDRCAQQGAPEGVDIYPEAQREAVDRLVNYLIDKYNINPQTNILGHGCITRNRMCNEPAGFEPPSGANWQVLRQCGEPKCIV